MTAQAFAHPAEPWVEADLDALPADGNRYEIIDGRLIATPPADDSHGARQARVAALLLASVPDGYDVVVQCGVRIPGGNVVADAAVLFPDARCGVVWRDPRDVALVVEVASPSTLHYDATDKLAAYARARIPSYWRISQDGTAHVYGLDGDKYSELRAVAPGEEWEASEPFPVRLTPAEWH